MVSIKLEEIGKLAVDIYLAKIEQEEFRKMFVHQYDKNRCQCKDESGCDEYCFHALTEEEYCDACKISQPYYDMWKKRVNISNGLKSKLTKEIQKYLKNYPR